MEDNDRQLVKDFLQLQVLVKQNTEDIAKLTKIGYKLAETSAQEDKKLTELISQLMTSNELCKQNQKLTFDKLNYKATKLLDFEKKLENKVSYKDFDKLTTRLWSIGISFVTIIIAMLGYLIKMQMNTMGGHP